MPQYVLQRLPAQFVLPESPFFNPWLTPFIGAAAGLILFGGLVGYWTGLWAEPLYLGYAAVIGAAASLSYSLLAAVLLVPDS